MSGRGGRGRTRLSLVRRRSDVDFYVGRVAKLGGPVLLLGSGRGHLALELAGRGIDVVGVEASARMTQEAEEARGQLAEPSRGRSRFVCSDLRTFRGDDRFRCVVTPWNVLASMRSPDEVDAVLRTAHHHLREDGVLMLDVLAGAAGKAVRGGGATGASRSPTGEVFIPHLRERRRETKGPGSRGVHRLELRTYHPDELDELLQAAGFSPTERYGGFDGSAWEPGCEVQIVIAERV